MLLSSHGRPDLDGEAWPNTGRLTVPEYRPLEFYCPPTGPAIWSEGDEICELGIRLKEIELLTLMGEALTAEDIVSACKVSLKLRSR
ncbi:hypothetical protein AAFF_G00382850 [Aldrovandia affinis]|uniref:Uncharacterized protein n=1 Tax=Aldrovandia affinis TaxID=143900 RepID=A0AAD7X109_9TELE|nr:hypothetical protein AAFF_G00382850 [Aldrovandia affinis]